MDATPAPTQRNGGSRLSLDPPFGGLRAGSGRWWGPALGGEGVGGFRGVLKQGFGGWCWVVDAGFGGASDLGGVGQVPA